MPVRQALGSLDDYGADNLIWSDSRRPRLRRATLVPVALVAWALSLLPAAAHSQPEANDRFDFDIAAQPLASALEAFARLTRRQVSSPGGRIRALTSQSVRGRLTPQTALERMIAETGLMVVAVNDIDFALRAAPVTAPERPQAATPRRIEELVVYGTKQNLSLQDTQTSVALYDAERIEEAALVTLDDILLRTPNVSAVNAQTNYAIRGIGQSGVGFAGTGLTSNVYVDGAPLSGNAQQGVQSLWDISQVEVLRGPQSTVQGRNALSGAIVMQTEDPGYEWTTRVRGQFATEESRRGSIALGGPLIDEQMAFRIAVDYQTYDGGVEEVISGIPQEFQDAYTYRAKLLIEPTALPGFRAELKAERVETEFGEFNTRFAPVSFEDPAFRAFDPYGDETFTRVRLEDSDADIITLELSQTLSDRWTLVGLGTYEDHTRDTRFCDTRPGSCILTGGPTATEQWSGELRALFDYERVTGWIGAYYFEQDLDRVLSFTVPVTLAPFPATPPDATISARTEQGQEIENFALFADVTLELSDRWSLNFGARYDREEFLDTGAQGSVTSNPPDCTADTPFGVIPCAALLPVAADPAVPADFEAFLPRVGLTYRFDEDRSLSLSVQRGYRAGGAELVEIPGTGQLVPVPFDPEYVTNYELAFRSQWYDNRLTLNANVFYLDWTDQQVTIPGPSGNPLAQDSFVDNVGESTVYGLELSLGAQLSDGLDLYASLGLLETEFTDFPFAPLDPTAQFADLSGNEFPAAPSLSAAFGVNYRHASGFYTNWNISHQSGRESDITNLAVNELGSYTLVNARLGYAFGQFNIYLFANNLFDDRFATRLEFAGINPATGALDVRPNARFQINEPRIAGLSIEFSL